MPGGARKFLNDMLGAVFSIIKVKLGQRFKNIENHLSTAMTSSGKNHETGAHLGGSPSNLPYVYLKLVFGSPEFFFTSKKTKR